jgi:hypothetical protein
MYIVALLRKVYFLKCSECRQLLVASANHVTYALIELKNNGGLTISLKDFIYSSISQANGSMNPSNEKCDLFLDSSAKNLNMLSQ